MRHLEGLPSAAEIKSMAGLWDGLPAMKEIYEREADVLCDLKDFKHDYVTNFKVRNFENIHRGFGRIAGEMFNFPGGAFVSAGSWRERARHWAVGQLIKRLERQGQCGRILPHGMLDAEVVEYSDSSKRRVVRRHKLGLVSVNLVTTAFVNYLTDALHNSADITLFKYHGSGTDNTAENAADTALIAEVGTRVSGNQTEGASANIYHTEAQLTYGSSLNIVEHGVFTASSAGTLMDRSVFTAIPVNTTTEILFKYELTSNSGG